MSSTASWFKRTHFSTMYHNKSAKMSLMKYGTNAVLISARWYVIACVCLSDCQFNVIHLKIGRSLWIRDNDAIINVRNEYATQWQQWDVTLTSMVGDCCACLIVHCARTNHDAYRYVNIYLDKCVECTHKMN